MASRVIWKFPIPIRDEVEIEMPRDADILTIRFQKDAPTVWALVDPRHIIPARWLVRMVGTGHEVDTEAWPLHTYKSTDMIFGGDFVLHFFIKPL